MMQFSRSPRGRRLTAACCAWWAATILCGTASAQSNSLRKRNLTRPVPSTQPARPARQILPPAARGPVRPIIADLDGTPPPNPALLRASLIAVQAPEVRKIRTHDLLTIIVREDKRSSSDADLKSEKTWELTAELRKWFRVHDHKLEPQVFPNGNPGIDFELDNQYEGEGSTKRKDILITRITATVTDVKPNGVLVLEATKTIELDEDIQIISLTGECRGEDVSAQNTILSTQIANANIRVKHTGPARDAARRGWLMRAFDLLRPF